ncbi:hypothetical protein IL306_005658 [Fusarium sp. DS 682]|nr:hypothetical protein IL306_005658 [Fusarium sp. DS 682]
MAEYNRQQPEETIHQKTGYVKDQLKGFITQLNEKSESEPAVPGLGISGANKQLEDVLGAAHDLLSIIRGTRENKDMTLSLNVEEEAASRPSAISPPLIESQMILEVISESISSIFRIGILVRKATSRDRFSQALQVSDLTFSKEADISYVQQKHPKLGQGWLSDRLGGAVAKRRQFIAYSRDHRSRLGGEESINDHSASRTEILSSKATTIAPCIDPRTLEEDEFDALSLVIASTMMDSSSLLRLPSHMATHGTFGDQQLKALEDAGRVSTYNLTAHDCPFCDEWADELKRKRDEQPNRVALVGACQDISVSISRFKRHVATHQEQLAMFAIPRATRDEIAYGEGSVISSMSGNGPSRIATDREEQGSPLPFGSSEQGSTPNEHEITSEEIAGSEKSLMLDRPAEDLPWENSEDDDAFSVLFPSQETEATGQDIPERRHRPGFPQTTARTPSPGPFDAEPAHLDYSGHEHLETSVTDYPKHDMGDRFVAPLQAGLIESIHREADLAPPPPSTSP